MSQINHLSDKAILVILDGFGYDPKQENKNAIEAAKTPNIDQLFSHYPMTTISAGGPSVGLPKGITGNSEVGHMNLGAGRPVRQDLVRINEAIENKSIQSMPKLTELIEYCQSNGNRVHLMGLLSDGGIHSHIDHLRELITIFNEKKIQVFLHAFMDGRDTEPDVGDRYIKMLESYQLDFTWASMQGRSIGMDRDRRWEKIEHSYKTQIGHGDKTNLEPIEYLLKERAEGRNDEFISPTLFTEVGAIQSKDAVFFFNFRPDRAAQSTLAYADPNFSEFNRPVIPGFYLCMTPYVQDDVDLPILFDKEKITGGLTEYLSSLGKNQVKVAETEKYPHVTYFFNGGERTPFKGEQHLLVPSPKEVATYDEKPEMSAYAVLEKVIGALKDSENTLTIVNFANSDMVGHTGNFDAAVKAIEVLDDCVGQIMKVCEAEDITMLLTADHGNSDQMVHPNGTPHTAHTNAPVPFSVFSKKLLNSKIESNGDFALKDVAPTILTVLGLDLPESFNGHSIF